MNQRVDNELTFDRAGHHAAHEVALQSEEDKQGRIMLTNAAEGHQVPVLSFFANQASHHQW